MTWSWKETGIVALMGVWLCVRNVHGQDDMQNPDSPREASSLVQRIRKSGGQPGFHGEKIVRLGIYEPQGDDHSFPYLSELVDLESLDINYVDSPAWVSRIVKLPRLQRLMSYRGSLTDESCEYLAQMKQLTELTLDVNEITDAGIAKIARLPNLEVLNLRFMPVTDAALVSISRLPKLRKLSFVHTRITPAGVLALRDSPIEELVWWVDSPLENNSFLPYVGRLRNVKRLNLASRFLDNEDLKSISGMVQLEDLDASEHRLTDAGLVHLRGLKNLKRLQLGLAPGDRDKGPGDAGMQHVAELTELESLGLNCTRLTDTGLMHLARLPKLKRLEVEGTEITPACIPLLEKLPELEELWITGTKLRDAESLDFRGCKSLKHVRAYEFDERKIQLPRDCLITTFD